MSIGRRVNFLRSADSTSNAMGWADDIRARFPDWGTEVARAQWADVRERLCIGQKVCGPVIARAPFGVWLDIGIGHPALLLVPQMRGAKEHRFSFDDYPLIGEVIEARIVAVGDRAEIGLSQNDA